MPVACSSKMTAMARAALALLCAFALPAAAEFDQGRAVDTSHAVLDWRDRPEVENRILTERLDTLLPTLMVETGIDMWVVIAREYAEDPVYFTLVPQPAHAARRTTMLVFFNGPEGLQKLSVNRYPLGEPYETGWSGGDLEAQWQGLTELIVDRDPQRIGINTSMLWPFADGLTHALQQRLMAALPERLRGRVVSAENLVVRWLETRIDSELALYPHIVGLARQVIGEAFSTKVITPGATTTGDIAWYIRERFAELQVPVWFQPDVNRQRAGRPCEKDNPICGEQGLVEPGDVLHTDVGICYLKLCTDTQEMAYVPRTGEEGVPKGLRQALALGNRWQDGLTDAFETGRSGNEILTRSLKAARRHGITASTYTHPLGFFGHGPGPTIGMWDNQLETPGRGDWPLAPMTAYAIEGNIKAPVPEWENNHVQIKLEQSAYFDGQRVIYLAGRQTRWRLVR